MNGRQVIGKCPVDGCQSEKGYADECDLGHQYMPENLIDPKSTLTGETPIMKDVENWYFDLPSYSNLLKDYPDVMEVDEVAEITGYCINTLRRWCKKGHLKPIMLRPKFLFPKPYVLDLLTSDFYENISAKSYTHAMHLNNIYKEYTELHTEKENENEN